MEFSLRRWGCGSKVHDAECPLAEGGVAQTCFPSALRALGAGDRLTCGFRDGRLRANEGYSGRSSRSTLESFIGFSVQML